MHLYVTAYCCAITGRQDKSALYSAMQLNDVVERYLIWWSIQSYKRKPSLPAINALVGKKEGKDSQYVYMLPEKVKSLG